MAVVSATPIPLDRFRLQAIVCMGAANALHIGAYELARSATTALFTSDTVGFTSTSAITLATGLVSPFSMVLLWIHRRVFDVYGPRRALLVTNAAYATLLATSALVLHGGWWSSGKTVLVLFVAKNSFVHLLMAQHGSFLTSVLPSSWLAEGSSVLAGVASVASTGAAWSVGPLLSFLSSKGVDGLTGLLMIAASGILMTLVLSEVAYETAQSHDFAPLIQSANTHSGEGATVQKPLPYRAMELFRRVPLLGAMCSEVLVCQSVSSLLSYLFVTVVKEKIPNDTERAKYTGKMYARINLSTTLLQFGFLPLVLSRLKRSRTRLWLLLPTLVLFPVLGMASSSSWKDGVPMAFGLLKIMEYSLRGILAEVAYGSMDAKSRFFGKELITLFANRLGKSGTALILAALTALVPAFYNTAPQLLLGLNLLWFVVSFQLVHLLEVKKAS